MASTTPNIGLTLPTGTEGWKRSVINGNFTILDTKIGAVGSTPLQTQINTLSSKIANLPNVAYTNVYGTNASQFETALTSAIANMGNDNVRICPCYANYSGSITNGGRGIVIFSRASTVYYAFIITTSSVKSGYYANDTWTWL